MSKELDGTIIEQIDRFLSRVGEFAPMEFSDHAYKIKDSAAFHALRDSLSSAIQPKIDVRLCSMTESNGRLTWIVQLARSADESAFDALQVYADPIKGRAEYEADRYRHFFGQGPEPDIMAYDTAAAPAEASITVLGNHPTAFDVPAEAGEPVAWGVPNTAITGRSMALMQVLLDKTGCQYPELLIPLYAGSPPVSAVPEGGDTK